MNLGVEDIARITNEPDLDQGIVQAKDKNVLFFAASEFNKIIGQNNFSMIDFLTTMYDGDDYEYQIKAGKTTLKDPLIGLVQGQPHRVFPLRCHLRLAAKASSRESFLYMVPANQTWSQGTQSPTLHCSEKSEGESTKY